MPKGPHEYTHNDSCKTHIIFLRFKQKKAKFRKERKLAIESWQWVTTLTCYRATETENNDENRPTYVGTRGEHIHEVWTQQHLGVRLGKLHYFNHKRTMLISIGH